MSDASLIIGTWANYSRKLVAGNNVKGPLPTCFYLSSRDTLLLSFRKSFSAQPFVY